MALNKSADLIEIKKCNFGHTKYTIAIPTYMRAESLMSALKSALTQNYSCNYKVIIVDNNPERNDDTERFMETIFDSNVSYFKNSRNVGMVNNWNQCILAADSEWVVFVHDDDLLTGECLENIDKMLRENPDVDVVLPNFKQKDNPYSKNIETGDNIKKDSFIKEIIRKIIQKDKPIAANLFCDNIYGPPTCGLALRRDAVVEFGGYPDRCIAADWDFMSQFSRSHKITKSKNLTGIYLWAVNASMKESTMEQIRNDRITIIKEIIKHNTICRIYYKLMKNDFEKKFNSKLTDYVDYSFLYKFLRKYYALRI